MLNGRHRHAATVAAAVLVSAIGVAAPAAGAPAGTSCEPKVIDLGTLGGPNSGVGGDNGRNLFVGDADTASGGHRAVIFHPNGTIVDLGQPDSSAADMNDAGIVVGNANIETPHSYAFAWYRGRSFRLPEPRWAAADLVRRINDRGDAAGIVFDQNGHAHPTVWIRVAFVHVLPIPHGYTDAEVLGINDRGELVGDASVASNGPDGMEQDAWQWRENGANHPLRPDYRGGGEQANVVNNRGWAGGGLDYGGQLGLWPAVWRNGTLTRLGPTGPGIQYGFAFGGDQIGDYVGSAVYSARDLATDQPLHVFLTKIGLHVLYTLRPLSGNLADGSHGHAVIPHLGRLGTVVGGDSTTTDGNHHATLWTCAWRQVIRPPAGQTHPTAPTNRPAGPRITPADLTR